MDTTYIEEVLSRAIFDLTQGDEPARVRLCFAAESIFTRVIETRVDYPAKWKKDLKDLHRSVPALGGNGPIGSIENTVMMMNPQEVKETTERIVILHTELIRHNAKTS